MLAMHYNYVIRVLVSLFFFTFLFFVPSTRMIVEIYSAKQVCQLCLLLKIIYFKRKENLSL